MSAEIRCNVCQWEGRFEDLPYAWPADAESHYCPSCISHAGPDGCMELIEDAPTAAPTLLDAAIAGSTALDPSGSRKSDDHLRVPTWEEREAERKQVAERIASMGRPA